MHAVFAPTTYPAEPYQSYPNKYYLIQGAIMEQNELLMYHKISGQEILRYYNMHRFSSYSYCANFGPRNVDA